MRISTESVFTAQTNAIDNLTAQETQYGVELSTGLAVTEPSDDPTQIAQDLSVRTSIGVQTQVGQNLTNVSSQLSSVDSALSSLTSVLQSARQLAVEGASTTNTPDQLKEIATQVQQLLNQSVSIANTQYAGEYIFAGTASPGTLPVAQNSTTPSVVTFSGNEVAQQQTLPGGQSITTSVTLQQAFNYNAANGSQSVFQVLQNLYNTLQNNLSVDESSTSINVAGAAITAGTTLSALTSATIATTPLAFDNGVPPEVTINIAGGSYPSGVNVSFTAGETIAQVVNAINSHTASTGVTASFNYQTERLSLAGTGSFNVTDVATPGNGATTTGNFVETFNLGTSANVVTNLSTQLGDIDNATQVLLNARAQIGSSIQEVNALETTSSTTVTNDTTVKSNIEDTNVAQVQPQFSLTQTALEAAYSVTSDLEQKTLFDYLT
jgi:flagellar hook-associated protein 3 FlgL